MIAEIDNTMLSLAGMDRKTIEDNIIKTIDVLFQNKKIKKAGNSKNYEAAVKEIFKNG